MCNSLFTPNLDARSLPSKERSEADSVASKAKHQIIFKIRDVHMGHTILSPTDYMKSSQVLYVHHQMWNIVKFRRNSEY